MGTERGDTDSKRRKGNELKLVNLESSTRIMDGIKDCGIPEWFLVELLIRLPAHVVCRFKLVSKQWLSMISDAYFLRRFNGFQLSRPWTIISRTMLGEGSEYSHFSDNGLLKTLYSPEPKFCVLPIPDAQKSQAKNSRIYGVSNGLVLYGLHMLSGMHLNLNPFSIMYYICNPITGQWIALPPTNCNFEEFGYGFLTSVEDCVLKSYTVVRIDMPIARSDHIRFEVFFSEIGGWKNFTVSNELGIQFGLRKAATALNGILHWVSREHGIIAYDPQRNPEQIRVIAFPFDPKRQIRNTSMCASHQGKLRFCEVSIWYKDLNGLPGFKVWELNDYSSGDWCLQHMDVEYDAHRPSDGSVFVPVCFHPINPDIVYLGCFYEFFSYNIKTRESEVQHKSTRKTRKSSLEMPLWVSGFLFEVPPWPISLL